MPLPQYCVILKSLQRLLLNQRSLLKSLHLMQMPKSKRSPLLLSLSMALQTSI